MVDSVQTRLTWAGHIMTARLELSRLPDIEITKRSIKSGIADAYRALLTGNKQSTLDSGSFFTPRESARLLNELLDNYATASDGEKRQFLLQAKMLADFLEKSERALNGQTPWSHGSYIGPLLTRVGSMMRASNEDDAAMMQEAVDTASKVIDYHEVEVLSQFAGEANHTYRTEVDRERNRISADVDARYAKYKQDLKVIKSKINAAIRRNDDAAIAEIIALKEEGERAWDDYKSHQDAETERYERLRNSAANRRDIAMSKPIAMASDLLDEIFAGSAVSDKQAEEWSERCKLPDNVLKKLAKIGYPADQFRKDCAEFYRLTGGRLPTINFILTGSQRAAAHDVGSVTSGAISVGSDFTKRTLFHELGHHLETDPAAKAMANAFLIKRRESSKLYKLKEIAPNSGYGSDEYAYKDGFRDPYIGKFYSDGYTEVFSMGLECLNSPKDLFDALSADPEHMSMVIGYAMTEPSPIMNAVMDAAKQIVMLNEESTSSQLVRRNELLDEIDKLLPVRPERLGDEPDEWTFKSMGLGKFIGSAGGYDLYSGKAKYRRHAGDQYRARPTIISVMPREGREPLYQNYRDPDVREAKAMILRMIHQGIGFESRPQLLTIQELNTLVNQLSKS
jgi:hypothetical protein